MVDQTARFAGSILVGATGVNSVIEQVLTKTVTPCRKVLLDQYIVIGVTAVNSVTEPVLTQTGISGKQVPLSHY